jgi:dTDP-4-dehydrorhamnose 3,5-epimerase
MDIRQVNLSTSFYKSLRGLHTQGAQTKIVTCVHGIIYDVVVDVRAGSPTLGRWFGCWLNASGSGSRSLFIPPGFAHGFMAFGNGASTVLYLCDREYQPQEEKTLLWNDPEIGVIWPAEPVMISKKDQAGETLKEYCRVISEELYVD